MTTPFDWINSITQESKNAVLEGSLDPSEYNPFIVNRGLSLFPDTIFYAQAMNTRPDIPAEAQYHFLHGLVAKRKRWSKWPKKELSKLDREFFDVLMNVYRYSNEKCEEISRILSPDQKKELIALHAQPSTIKKK